MVIKMLAINQPINQSIIHQTNIMFSLTCIQKLTSLVDRTISGTKNNEKVTKTKF